MYAPRILSMASAAEHPSRIWIFVKLCAPALACRFTASASVWRMSDGRERAWRRRRTPLALCFPAPLERAGRRAAHRHRPPCRRPGRNRTYGTVARRRARRGGGNACSGWRSLAAAAAAKTGFGFFFACARAGLAGGRKQPCGRYAAQRLAAGNSAAPGKALSWSGPGLVPFCGSARHRRCVCRARSGPVG